MRHDTVRHLRDSSTDIFPNNAPKTDAATFRNLTYGVFVLTTKGEKENGCIVNTAVQVASKPDRIAISVQKGNYTRELIEQSGEFNISVLTEDVPFEAIRHFGMQTGRETDKFADFTDTDVASNGIRYINKYTNAFFSAKVVSSTDLGSHVMFVGEITESKVLGTEASCTYAHYHKAIRPR